MTYLLTLFAVSALLTAFLFTLGLAGHILKFILLYIIYREDKRKPVGERELTHGFSLAAYFKSYAVDIQWTGFWLLLTLVFYGIARLIMEIMTN